MIPSLTIITAVFNGSSTIADCLNSVNAQTYPATHVIVDGSSTDDTLDIVRQHSPHAYILSEPDNGIYDAMNKGINIAASEVIGILNADDFYASPEVLAKVAAAFADPAVSACYGDLVYVRESGRRYEAVHEQEAVDIKPSMKCPKFDSERSLPKERIGNDEFPTVHSSFKVVRYWKSGNYNVGGFYWGWMPPHPTFFVRKSIYEKYGMFNIELGSAADYELMLRFLLKHRIGIKYIPEILVKMRVGGASNASLKNRIMANRMDRRAWNINGLKPYPWTLSLKPLRKLPQYFLR